MDILKSLELNEALLCAIYSRSAYNRNGYGFRSMIMNGDAFFIESKQTDTQAYLIRSEKAITFVGRGTEKKIRDIITDIWATPTEVPYDASKTLRAHSGFLNAYKSIRMKVLSYIEYELKKDPELQIIGTGHSLGATLADWFVLDVQKNKFQNSDNIFSYTFGSPKIGNSKLADSYDRRIKNSFRFVNPLDPVTILPLTGRHHDKRIKLKGKKGHDINHYIENISKII